MVGSSTDILSSESNDSWLVVWVSVHEHVLPFLLNFFLRITIGKQPPKMNRNTKTTREMSDIVINRLSTKPATWNWNANDFVSAFILHYSDLCTKTKWHHRQKRPQAGSISVLITDCKFERVGETSQNKSWFRKKMEIYVSVLNVLYTLIWRVTKRILLSGSNCLLPTPT